MNAPNSWYVNRWQLKIVKAWTDKVRLRDKESPDWYRDLSVTDVRNYVRNQVSWAIKIPEEFCERVVNRFPPDKIITLNKYIWTITSESNLNDIDFTIWNISDWWIQVITDWHLRQWEKITISFFLDTRYTFEWEVVWKKWNKYWVKFLLSKSSNHRIVKSHANLKNLLELGLN